MNVLLINPPSKVKYPQPPIGLAVIANAIESIGNYVEIVDMNIKDLSPSLLKRKSDAIGLSTTISNIHSAAVLAKSIRELSPNTRIIAGGPFASMLPEATMESIPEIDAIVRGEGEVTIQALLTAYSKYGRYKDIKGISYRSNGQIFHNPDSDILACIDESFPSYYLLPMQSYRPHPPRGRAKPYALMVTSRGCPYSCNFCAKPMFGSHYRAQTPERVIKEIKLLRDKYGIKEIGFYDDIFNLHRDRVIELCNKMISQNADILWSCESRVNLVDRFQLKSVKMAGCYMVAYGIESGCQHILDRLNKGIELEQVEEALRLTKEAGMETLGYFMIGNPGETIGEIRRTIEYAKKLPLDYAQFAVTIPYPGTELYDSHNKSELDKYWTDIIKNKDAPLPIFESADYDRDRLKSLSLKAYRDFYLRPSYILNRLFGNPVLNMRGAIMFVENYLR